MSNSRCYEVQVKPTSCPDQFQLLKPPPPLGLKDRRPVKPAGSWDRICLRPQHVKDTHYCGHYRDPRHHEGALGNSVALPMHRWGSICRSHLPDRKTSVQPFSCPTKKRELPARLCNFGRQQLRPGPIGSTLRPSWRSRPRPQSNVFRNAGRSSFRYLLWEGGCSNSQEREMRTLLTLQQSLTATTAKFRHLQ